MLSLLVMYVTYGYSHVQQNCIKSSISANFAYKGGGYQDAGYMHAWNDLLLIIKEYMGI